MVRDILAFSRSLPSLVSTVSIAIVVRDRSRVTSLVHRYHLFSYCFFYFFSFYAFVRFGWLIGVRSGAILKRWAMWGLWVVRPQNADADADADVGRNRAFEIRDVKRIEPVLWV